MQNFAPSRNCCHYVSYHESGSIHFIQHNFSRSIYYPTSGYLDWNLIEKLSYGLFLEYVCCRSFYPLAFQKNFSRKGNLLNSYPLKSFIRMSKSSEKAKSGGFFLSPHTCEFGISPNNYQEIGPCHLCFADTLYFFQKQVCNFRKPLFFPPN